MKHPHEFGDRAMKHLRSALDILEDASEYYYYHKDVPNVDPDVRRSTAGAFSSVSSLLRSVMERIEDKRIGNWPSGGR